MQNTVQYHYHKLPCPKFNREEPTSLWHSTNKDFYRVTVVTAGVNFVQNCFAVLLLCECFDSRRSAWCWSNQTGRWSLLWRSCCLSQPQMSCCRGPEPNQETCCWWQPVHCTLWWDTHWLNTLTRLQHGKQSTHHLIDPCTYVFVCV